MEPVDPCAVKSEALELLSAGDVPELVVLDLDYTVWRCFIDSLGGPPFKVGSHWGACCGWVVCIVHMPGSN